MIFKNSLKIWRKKYIHNTIVYDLPCKLFMHDAESEFFRILFFLIFTFLLSSFLLTIPDSSCFYFLHYIGLSEKKGI